SLRIPYRSHTLLFCSTWQISLQPVLLRSFLEHRPLRLTHLFLISLYFPFAVVVVKFLKISSAVARLVANGILWTSQILINIWTSSSWGCLPKGYRKNITKSSSYCAAMAAICASQPIVHDSSFCTSKPALTI